MEDNKNLQEMEAEPTSKPQENGKPKVESSASSNTSGSEESSDSSVDDNNKPEQKAVGNKSPAKVSRSRSRSKEKSLAKSHSRSVSPDDDYRKNRGQRYNDDKSGRYDSKPGDKRKDSRRMSPHTRRRLGARGRYVDSRSTSRSQDRGSRRDYGREKRKLKIFVPGLDGHLVSFRQFMQMQPEKLDWKKVEKIYNKYKKDYEEKQIQIFFSEHKSDQWMIEKYDPFLAEKLRTERIEESQTSAKTFFQDLKDGVYDKLNLNISDYNPKLLLNQQRVEIPELANKIEEETAPGEPSTKPVSEVVEIVLDEDVDITKEPFFGFDPNSLTLFIKSIPSFVSRWDLREELKKFPGFLSLSLSEPLKSQEYIRLGWILFDIEDHCNKAFELLSNLVIKGYQFNIVKSKSQKKPIKVCTLLNKKKNDENIELSKQLIQVLDKERKIEDNPLLTAENQPSKQMDLQVLYLRKVHSYCFYSASEYYDERMMVAKCGPIFLRTQIEEDEGEMPEFSDWHKKIQENVKQRIQESTVVEEASKDDIENKIQTEIDKLLKEKVEKLSEPNIWPCKYCPKVFQDMFFVVKHIKAKHADQVDKLRQKVIEPMIYENYSKDKNKITPLMNPSYPNFNQSSNSRFPNKPGFHHHHHHYHHHGGKKFPRGSGPSRTPNFPRKDPQDYKDLDEPTTVSGKVSRTIVDYNDI